MLSVVVATVTDQVRVYDLDDDDSVLTTTDLDAGDLATFVREREQAPGAPPPRWVWSDTATWYPPLLAAGVTVARCWDLRLCHAILRASALTAHTSFASADASVWDQPRTQTGADRLFDLEPPPAPRRGGCAHRRRPAGDGQPVPAARGGVGRVARRGRDDARGRAVGRRRA